MPRPLLLPALTGFLAVALGAFGAHALRDILTTSGHLETWRTAVLYHLVHAGVLTTLGLATLREDRFLRWARTLFLTGIALFSGSLYALSLGAPPWLGPITPVGGLLLLSAWLLLAASACNKQGKNTAGT